MFNGSGPWSREGRARRMRINFKKKFDFSLWWGNQSIIQPPWTTSYYYYVPFKLHFILSFTSLWFTDAHNYNSNRLPNFLKIWICCVQKFLTFCMQVIFFFPSKYLCRYVHSRPPNKNSPTPCLCILSTLRCGNCVKHCQICFILYTRYIILGMFLKKYVKLYWKYLPYYFFDVYSKYIQYTYYMLLSIRHKLY